MILLRIIKFAAAGAATAAIAFLPSASADASAGFEDITAQFQGYQSGPPGAVIVINGLRVSAEPLLIRVEGQATCSAFSLNVFAKPSSATAWTAVNPTTEGLRAVASAYWMTQHGSTAGHPLKNNQFEKAAEQIAIWSVSNSLSISAKSVPNPLVRARALELYRLEPGKQKNVNYTIGLIIHPYVRSASASNVQVAVDIAASNVGEQGILTDSQYLQIGLDNVTTKVYTDKTTQISVTHSRLVPKVVGGSPNNNVAYIDLPRINDSEDLETYWDTDVDAGEIFLSVGTNSPPVITDQSFPVEVYQNLNLDPSQFPDVQGLIQGWILDVLSHLNGWEVIAAVLLGLYLAHTGFSVVDFALVHGYKRIKGRLKASGAQSTEGSASSSASASSPGSDSSPAAGTPSSPGSTGGPASP